MKLWVVVLLWFASVGYAYGEEREDVHGLYRIIWSDGEKHDVIFGIAGRLDGQWELTDGDGVFQKPLEEAKRSVVAGALGEEIADASFCLNSNGVTRDIFCMTKPGLTTRFHSHDFFLPSGDFTTRTNYFFYLEMSGIFDLEKVADTVPIPPPGDDGELLKRAEEGDVKAQCEAGRYYLWHLRAGDSESAYAEKTMEWLNKCAAQGDRDALTLLAYAYHSGGGVKQSFETAFAYYQAAADKGDIYAMCRLGDMLFKGLGVPRDAERGARWYIQAAELGDASAQTKLIELYSSGEGVPEDAAKTLEWAQTSIDRSDSGYWGLHAMFLLGKAYAGGNAVPRRPEKAVYWMRRAALGGLQDAELALAGYYKNGLGSVAPDPVLAVVWLRRAEFWGVDRDISDDLRGLEAGLTEAQRQEAEELGRQVSRGEIEPGTEPE